MDIEQIFLFPDASDASMRGEDVFGTPSNNDEDVSVLEFARLHGLSKDFRSENPIDPQLLPHPITDDQNDSEDGVSIAGLNSAIVSALKERLVVDKNVASFLRAIFTLQRTEIEEETTLPRRRTADLKQELPMLKTDDELDLQSFGAKTTPDFSNVNLPLEVVDNEKDEGLEWSTVHYDLPAQYYSQANAERLEIPRDALLYLQEIFREPFTAMNVDDVTLAELHYERVSTVPTISASAHKMLEQVTRPCYSAVTSNEPSADTVCPIFARWPAGAVV